MDVKKLFTHLPQVATYPKSSSDIKKKSSIIHIFLQKIWNTFWIRQKRIMKICLERTIDRMAAKNEPKPAEQIIAATENTENTEK
jgi:hypothetical protein